MNTEVETWMRRKISISPSEWVFNHYHLVKDSGNRLFHCPTAHKAVTDMKRYTVMRSHISFLLNHSNATVKNHKPSHCSSKEKTMPFLGLLVCNPENLLLKTICQTTGLNLCTCVIKTNKQKPHILHERKNLWGISPFKCPFETTYTFEWEHIHHTVQRKKETHLQYFCVQVQSKYVRSKRGTSGKI